MNGKLSYYINYERKLRLDGDFFEEGGWYIVEDEGFNLYSIPQYGGEESFEGNFKTIKEAIEKAKTFI